MARDGISGLGTRGFVFGAALGSALMEQGGEIGREVGVEGDDLGDVTVDLLDEGHVLDHVVRDSRLVVLVHLLDQRSVPIQHRLHLPETLVKGIPHLAVAAFVSRFSGGS